MWLLLWFYRIYAYSNSFDFHSTIPTSIIIISILHVFLVNNRIIKYAMSNHLVIYVCYEIKIILKHLNANVIWNEESNAMPLSHISVLIDLREIRSFAICQWRLIWENQCINQWMSDFWTRSSYLNFIIICIILLNKRMLMFYDFLFSLLYLE